MDGDPLTWILVGTGCFALLGFLFGAVVYWVGRRGGGRFGSALVDLLGPVPPTMRRAIAGGLDGALFLGVIGLVLGMVAGPKGIVYGLTALVLLMLATFVFAGLAHNLTGRRSPVITVVCSGLIGLMVGLMVSDGKFYGAAIGLVAGLVAGALAGIHPHVSQPNHVDAGPETLTNEGWANDE